MSGDAIYLVCGVPRSGTSMLMRCLEVGGLPCLYNTRDDARRNADCPIVGYCPNPHGYYELDYLAAFDWRAARGKAVKLVSGNLHVPPPGEQYRAVYLRRDPAEISRSFRGVSGPHPAATAWRGDYESAVAADLAILSGRLGATVATLDYATVVSDPAGQLSRLGWPIDVARAAATVDPALYRHRAT